MLTRWARPSPEIIVSSIATPAGALITGGDSLPPAPIVKVAGRRTLVAPEVLDREVVDGGVVAVLGVFGVIVRTGS
jgi:hypothetical protein